MNTKPRFSTERIIQWGGNFLFSLLAFVIIFDPTSTILHLKDVFFVLLVAYNIFFFKPNLKYIPHLLIFVSVPLLCYVFAEMQGNVVDQEKFVAVLKSFAPLVMLLWIHRYNLIKLSMIPVALVGLVMLVLYCIACSSSDLEYLIFLFMCAHDNTVMMNGRTFLGFSLFSMYLKSLVSLLLPLALYMYYLFNLKAKKRFFLIIPTFMVFFTFLISGSRSTMLLPIFLLGVLCYQKVRYSVQVKYFVYPVLVLFAFLFIGFILLLASEKGEYSNMVKYNHFLSYQVLFEDNPIYLFIGQGPGTSFYTTGFNRMTDETELTYFELLRNYGMFCLPLLWVVMSPLYTFARHVKEDFSMVVLFAYIGYLLVAGTNPLLLSSTGMIVVLSAYSYKEMLIAREQCELPHLSL